ncbi:MAG: 2-C-methyl-D-erythritol 2,4-cyclodiphosphate synthase [bacterium]|jgi:2-C-methyl-D-erythritol 2,4-cyclodiphosphate synthase|nr:2-C-methyl-D-erythritol 2,4-cyclodiphosphate synthase [bacterium]
MKQPMRIGTGFDLHQWAEGRRFVLGGVEIPYEMGLLGHSDADALIHAIIDALFGALALGDIGQHFPDTDPRYKDVNSMELLRAAMVLVHDAGYRVSNLDCTVVTEAPKLAPHIRKMRRTLAPVLAVDEEDLSIKATRTENVLFSAQDGLLAMATVLLLRMNG